MANTLKTLLAVHEQKIDNIVRKNNSINQFNLYPISQQEINDNVPLCELLDDMIEIDTILAHASDVVCWNGEGLDNLNGIC